jgi:hypothetical protein
MASTYPLFISSDRRENLAVKGRQDVNNDVPICR